MSGSGGGGGGGSRDPGPSKCELLVIDTQVSSPKASVVEKIATGALLDVAIQKRGQTTVVVVLHKGQLAGGVAAPQVNRLRECIEGGYEYKAKVTEKKGAQIRIRIKLA